MSSGATVTVPNERATLLTLAAVQFTNVLDFMIMMPLGSHLMRAFGISPAQFSLLAAAYGFSAALFGFVGGFVLDRYDRKRALLVLYAGFVVATLACALAPTYHALLLARLAAGAFGGVAGSVLTAMVGDLIPPERRGSAMATVMMAFPLASVMGIPAGLWLASAFEWHAPFFMLAISSALVWPLAARVLPHPARQLSVAPPGRQMWEILAHPVHQRAFLLSAVLVMAGALIIPFMAPAMVANVGLSEGQLSWIYLVGGVATFFTRPLIGRLTDSHDKVRVLGWISLGSMITVPVLTLLPETPVPVALVVTTILFVTMSGRFSPAMTMVTNAVEERYRGGFMSVNSALQQATAGVANLIAGFLITRDAATGRLIGYPLVGVLSVACFALTVFLAWRLKVLVPRAAFNPRIETV